MKILSLESLPDGYKIKTNVGEYILSENGVIENKELLNIILAYETKNICEVIIIDKLINANNKITTVVNINKSSYDVYIGRAGHGLDGYFGNPFVLKNNQQRGETLKEYEKYFNERLKNDENFKNRIHKLKGKTLGCFCKPNPCHGDIIKKYLDKLDE